MVLLRWGMKQERSGGPPQQSRTDWQSLHARVLVAARISSPTRRSRRVKPLASVELPPGCLEACINLQVCRCFEMPLQGRDVLKWTALRPGADKRSSSYGSLRNQSLVCVQDFGLGFNFATSNPFPVILNSLPPLPNIKTEIRRFGFNIRGVSGAYGYDWDYCNQTVAPEP